jgi:hypothetical protein
MYVLRDGDTIRQVTGCHDSPAGPCEVWDMGVDFPPMIPTEGSAEVIRAAIEAWISSVQQYSSESRSHALFGLVQGAMATRTTTSAVRAELLRLLADDGSIGVEPGATNLFGIAGTRFTVADTATGTALAIIVDPGDGFLLQTSFGTTRTGDPVSVTAWQRPVVDPILEGPAGTLARQLASHRTEIEAASPTARCVLTLLGPGGDTMTVAVPRDPDPTAVLQPGTPASVVAIPRIGDIPGIEVPEGWAYSHCW